MLPFTEVTVPKIDLATWDFRVFGEVDAPFTLTWQQFRELPRKQVHTDIHCVTRWSRYDNVFGGVPVQDLEQQDPGLDVVIDVAQVEVLTRVGLHPGAGSRQHLHGTDRVRR